MGTMKNMQMTTNTTNVCYSTNCLTAYKQRSSNVYWYSEPSPFTGITFLKNPMNSAAMVCKVKTLWEKWG
jgi:hypothetical protein